MIALSTRDEGGHVDGATGDPAWDAYVAEQRQELVDDLVRRLAADGVRARPLLDGDRVIERDGAPLAGWPVRWPAPGAPGEAVRTGLAMSTTGRLFVLRGDVTALQCGPSPEEVALGAEELESLLEDAAVRLRWGLDRPASSAFACRRCGSAVTGTLREVAYESLLPGGSPPVQPAPLTDLGTFAVDLGPFGRGGARATVVVHPRDVVGARRHPDESRVGSFCCGPSGLSGPNLVCATCGQDVGTEVTECYLTHSFVRLEPDHVDLLDPSAGTGPISTARPL